MTWVIVAGVVIGAGVGAGSSAARGAKGWDIAKGGLIGGVSGAATGGVGGLLGGAAGGLLGGGGGAAAGTGVTAMGSGMGGALGSGAIGTGMTAAEMSASALPGVTAGESGGFMGALGSMATPQNMNTLTGMLGGGQQQQKGPQSLPPVAPVSSQPMGGMAQMAQQQPGLVSTQMPNPLGSEFAQLMMMKKLGLV